MRGRVPGPEGFVNHTYFTALVAAHRVLRRRLGLGPFGSALVVLALSYGLAFLETFTMAAALMSARYASTSVP
jgi:hypothetical protein